MVISIPSLWYKINVTSEFWYNLNDLPAYIGLNLVNEGTPDNVFPLESKLDTY